MISLHNVSKAYPLRGGGKYTVFRNLSFTIPERKHIGIVGRNGAGKSTLLRLIGGTELPDTGRIVSSGTISPPLGLSSGLSPHLTGRDNTRFVCRINGDTPEVVRERMNFVMEFAELGGFFDEPVQTYSSGMRARLAFAMSMAYEYDYYLIDELTAVGDQKFREKAESAFAEKKGRSSIIMVSHNLAVLQRDCEVGIYMSPDGPQYFEDIKEAVDVYRQAQKRTASN